MTDRALIVGSGGREHALAWKLAQSKRLSQIFVIPGNGGTSTIGPNVVNVPNVPADDFEQLLAFALKQKITLLIPGPEAPLVDGITDYFRANGPASISIFGPSKAAARMEGSKAFAKDFMQRHKLPTAAYQTFTSHEEAQAYLVANPNMKIVIKASGLAAGKGVIIPESQIEASKALRSIMLEKEFGSAGDSVVIEEFLEGEELSVLSFSDGYTVQSLPAAQDHKRIFDNDEGPNTGGMGCYAPTAIATPAVMDRIHREALQPTIDGLRKSGTPFVGCLFTGFMLTEDGPKILEYNVRFGDPETQTLLPLLKTDLATVMFACTSTCLDSVQLEITPGFSTTVVVAAKGYPGKYGKGQKITLSKTGERTAIFHAGTSHSPPGELVASGGRVIASTSWGPDISTAVSGAYSGICCIEFDGMHYRRDIAHRAFKQKEHQNPDSNGRLTYASAGVSISAGNDLVTRIKPLVAKTKRPGANGTIGGFGGDFSLADAGYPKSSPTLILAIDGIGTKLLIAEALGDYSTVGIDLVAMNVNDLVVQGAEPLAFVDYYATGRLNNNHAVDFVKGVTEGCIQAGCALLGGETAEMPDVYGIGKFDGAGTAMGAVAQGRGLLPDKGSMREGDILLGLASSGFHSNGFSLVRKIVQRSGLSYDEPAPWDKNVSLGRALLEPTRIYVKSLLSALDHGNKDQKLLIKGMAHITGGGLVENIPRMLPDQLAARLDVTSWVVPAALSWAKRLGRLESIEFARTFNTGIGMVLVVPSEDAERVKRLLHEAGETVYQVGKLVERKSGEESCVLDNLQHWET